MKKVLKFMVKILAIGFLAFIFDALFIIAFFK